MLVANTDLKKKKKTASLMNYFKENNLLLNESYATSKTTFWKSLPAHLEGSGQFHKMFYLNGPYNPPILLSLLET